MTLTWVFTYLFGMRKRKKGGNERRGELGREEKGRERGKKEEEGGKRRGGGEHRTGGKSHVDGYGFFFLYLQEVYIIFSLFELLSSHRSPTSKTQTHTHKNRTTTAK